MLALAAPAYRRPDSVRLLALPFDFTATLTSPEGEEAPAWPQPVPSLLAVARNDYRVSFHALEPRQFEWLAGLPAGGPGGAPPGGPTPPGRLPPPPPPRLVPACAQR